MILVPTIIEALVPFTAVCLFSKEVPWCPSEPLKDFRATIMESKDVSVCV